MSIAPGDIRRAESVTTTATGREKASPRVAIAAATLKHVRPLDEALAIVERDLDPFTEQTRPQQWRAYVGAIERENGALTAEDRAELWRVFLDDRARPQGFVRFRVGLLVLVVLAATST